MFCNLLFRIFVYLLTFLISLRFCPRYLLLYCVNNFIDCLYCLTLLVGSLCKGFALIFCNGKLRVDWDCTQIRYLIPLRQPSTTTA